MNVITLAHHHKIYLLYSITYVIEHADKRSACLLHYIRYVVIQALHRSLLLLHIFIHVCLCVCVCVCVCLTAIHFYIAAPIATKLHACTKDLLGKVLEPMSISQTYRNGLIGRAADCSHHGFLNNCQARPSTNFLYHSECKTQNHSYAKVSSCETGTSSTHGDFT